MNASDRVDKPAACGPHSESQHLDSLDFNPSPGRLQKDVTTDPLCAAEVSTSKCRREYDSMMVMLPTWGFWRKRMVQGGEAWAKKALTTRNGTQSGSLCYKTCSFISRTSPALDPRDYTCWKDAYATGRLHRNLHSQPRSAWKSRYGERLRTHAHTNTNTQTWALSLNALFFGLHVEILTRFSTAWEICVCAANAFELYFSPEQSAFLMHMGCSRMMTSNPAQRNRTSLQIAVLLVM